jgi:hypothetical protein
MQINTGKVTATIGNATVQGNPSVDWSQVLVGNLFFCQGAVHTIVGVNSGTKQITISPPWALTTATDVDYAIARDFTTNHNLPLMNPGDVEGASIFSEAIKKIDSLLSTSGSTTNEILVSVASSFQVGNIVTLNTSGTWILANSSSIANSIAVGMVTFKDAK